MEKLVFGAMGSLVPKLYELLKEEYKLQTGVKDRIRSLTLELELAQAALRQVAEVPWDQLDKQVQIWARKVREASYDMDDVLDTFLVRVQGSESTEEEQSFLKRHLKKVIKFFKKSKARRKISGDIKDIMSYLQEMTKQFRRYKVDNIVPSRDTSSPIDPRLHAMYTQVDKLVGITKSSSKLKSMLKLDDMSNTKMKTVSVVGIGGLGKTTLAKAVYDNIRGDFNCGAFVSVGRNPDLKKVLQMILIALDKERCQKLNFAVLQDITQFIDELREFFQQNKRNRYIIVIDDVWENQSWEILKFGIADNKSCEGRIIITTRKWEVANNADEVYELPSLPYDSSRKLFYTRIYGDEINHIDYTPDEVSDKIQRKCAGIPLAIIVMASLLVNEPRDRWFEVYKSVGFGCKDNEDAENIMNNILSFSYYDLPLHLRACLLYISAFLEDSIIDKVPLIWMWVAEGFVQKREGTALYEIGESFFNDLINRSMIQEVDNGDGIHSCRVHDMVLDFVRSISLEENFFTIFDNNYQGRLVRSNVVRRLAHHNKAMVLSNQANMFDMSKVRSFIVPECGIDTWASLSSFKLLRVLNIGYSDRKLNQGPLTVEHLGHLHHLRFLRITGVRFKKIPAEIGALKMLQTLDLFQSQISIFRSTSRLPTQLVCLRIAFEFVVHDAELFSMGRLTSLEELSIQFYGWGNKISRHFVKELGSLMELRVLNIWMHSQDDEMERDLIEFVRHLHKLQHLKIIPFLCRSLDRRWPEMDFVLSGDLRSLGLSDVLWKLPSCIDPLCHRKLSHLELCLLYMNEQELKTLGRLPELRFLELDLRRSSPTICNISDSDACYFPKLRCLKLRRSLVLFVANKGGDDKKTVSFRIWDGKVDDNITKPHSLSDAGLQGDDEVSSVSQWEVGRGPVGEKSGIEWQLVSVSGDVQHSRRSSQPSKLQQGIAMAPVSDEEKKEGSISTREGDGEGTATPRFMPRLQKLDFSVREQAIWDPRYCNNLGLEFLSSLQVLGVNIKQPLPEYDTEASKEEMEAALKEVEAALRSAAQVGDAVPVAGRHDGRRRLRLLRGGR